MSFVDDILGTQLEEVRYYLQVVSQNFTFGGVVGPLTEGPNQVGANANAF
jgi:hypothetical protein